MRVYTVGDLVLSPYAEQLGNQVPQKDGIVVCNAHDITDDVLKVVKESGCRLFVVGCPDEETASLLPADAQIVPYYNCFGSLQFLFEKLCGKTVEQKGIFRFVRCSNLGDEKSCLAQARTRFSSILFLLEKAIGAVKSKYGKVFRNEGYLRFNAIVTMENGTIFFYEEKFSATAVPSEYWEYAFNDGIMVSDSYRELPLLCISENGEKRLLDGLRITGNLDRVASILQESSVAVSAYKADKAASDMNAVVAECF